MSAGDNQAPSTPVDAMADPWETGNQPEQMNVDADIGQGQGAAGGSGGSAPAPADPSPAAEPTEIGYDVADLAQELSFDEATGLIVIPEQIGQQFAANIRASPSLHRAIYDWHRNQGVWPTINDELKKQDNHKHKWDREEGYFITVASRGAIRTCRHPCVIAEGDDKGWDEKGRPYLQAVSSNKRRRAAGQRQYEPTLGILRRSHGNVQEVPRSH